MEDVKQLADKYADQYGLPRDLFRAQIQQESAWNPNAVSKVGALGLTQIMPDTAAKPGYGVRPLQDKSIDEQLRFGAEYMAALVKANGGKYDLALASYNAGHGTVQKAGGIPKSKETQDYVNKILGGKQVELQAVEAAPAGNFAEVYAARQAKLGQYSGVVSQLPLAPVAPDRAALIQGVVDKRQAREAERLDNPATFAESFEFAVAKETAFGALMELADAGPVDPNWKRTKDDEMLEAAAGFVEVPEVDAYVKGARNEKDYRMRLAKANMQMEQYKKVADTHGWGFVNSFLGSLAGAAADPVAAAASAFVGNALNAARVGKAAWRVSKLGRPLINAGEGAISGAGVSLAIQEALNTETSWGRVLEDSVFGAAFGGALSAPSAARYAAREARDMAAWDRSAQGLGEAIDGNAPSSHVQHIQQQMDDIRLAMVERASAQGDEIGAAVWASAGPGLQSKDIHGVARAMRERADAGIVDDVQHAPNTRSKTWAVDSSTETVDVRGMRLSKEASAIRDFAYNVWKEETDPVLADMQKRMRAWYDVREQKLKNYGGLSQWLDSPGLVLGQSKSKVARMLGAHMFESATGMGKREQSAALNYEVMHSRLAHSYIPELKAALYDGLKERQGSAFVRNLFGGGRREESQFWRDVMVERTKKRNAINNKQEHNSTASPSVQKAASILDKFWGDAASQMETAGIEEGTAIKKLGIAGHVPYIWNARKIAEALRSEPAMFDALQSLLQAEFRNKVLDKALDGLAEQGQAKLKAKVTNLEGDIAAIQDSIADMENTRQTVDTARDKTRDAKAVVDDLNAQRKAIVATEKKLKTDLKTAVDDGDVPQTDALPESEGYADAFMGVTELGDDIVGEVVEALDAPRTEVDFPYNRTTGAPTRAQLRAKGVPEGKVSDMFEALRAIELPKEERLLADTLMKAYEADWGDRLNNTVVFLDTANVRAYHNSSQGYIRMFVPELAADGTISPTNAMTFLHELTHARTSRWINILRGEAQKLGLVQLDAEGYAMEWAPPAKLDVVAMEAKGIPTQITEAWNMLEDVRGMLMAKYPKAVGSEFGLGYAMKNSHELLAQVVNSKLTRDFLRDIKLDGEVSLLRRVWEAVARALGITDNNALAKVVTALDRISEVRGTFRSRTGGVVSMNFAEGKPTKGQIKAQLAKLKEQKAEIDGKLKQLREQKKTVQEAAKKVNATENAEKLKNLRLQLAARKAELADIQRDPLGWWAKQVDTLRNAAYAKADNLTSSYLQQIIRDPKSRVQANTLHATRLAEDLLNENWAGQKIDEELAEEFATKLRERLADKTRTEFDLGKSLDVNGRGVALMDFMDLDGIAQVKSGSHSASGRVALAKMGITDEVDADAAITAARTDGASDEEIAALQFGLDFFLNRMDSSDPAALHALRNMTYFTRMGKLGMSIVADVPMVVGTLGLKTGLKVWGQSFLQLNLFDSSKPYNGKPTEFAKQLAVVAPGALGRDFRLISLVPDDPASGVSDLNAATLMQRASARGAQLTSYISGANAVNMAMHRALLPILSEELLKAVRGKSRLSDVRLADAGLTPDVIERIKMQMDVFDKNRKQGDKVNWDQWEDQDAADLLIGAIHRAMFQTLQKSLIGEKPSWMATSQLGRLIGQFRSFGMTAAEKQSARLGVGVHDAGVVVSAVMGIVWASLMYYARVNMNALGREDADEYVKEATSGMRLAAGVMTMWSMSGIGADFAGVMGTLFGGTQYTNSGPAAALGVLQDIQRAGGAVGGLVTGDSTAADATKATARLLPGANSVPITYLLNEMSEN